MSDAAGSRTPEEQALTEEIERTREQLGETVEALAAKVDVKARAQRRATEVKDNLRGKTRAIKQKVTGQAKGTALATSAPVRAQLSNGAAGAARAVRGITPEPVQRSAGQAVVIVRGHRGQAAAAGLATAALILAWLAVRRPR